MLKGHHFLAFLWSHTFCHSLCLFYGSHRPTPRGLRPAHLAPSPSRTSQRKAPAGDWQVGRRRWWQDVSFPLPACSQVGSRIFSRCSLSCDFSCWMLPQTTSSLLQEFNCACCSRPCGLAAPHCCFPLLALRALGCTPWTSGCTPL